MKQRFFRLHAPAKVNLGLRILGRGTDGFHQLETLFHSIALGDVMHLRVDSSLPPSTTLIADDGGATPLDASNSAQRAIASLRRLGAPLGAVTIRLEKGIPVGGGLGGSSADAAAIFKGLIHYLPASVNTAAITRAALELGSDVPFLIRGGCAHALGRGEILSPRKPWQGRPLWLIIPPFSCATPKVFAALKDRERAPRCALGPVWWQQQWESGRLDFLHNDLLQPALRVEPRLKAVAQWLAQQPIPWAMSGSGSTFFSLAPPQGPAPLGCQVVQSHFTNPAEPCRYSSMAEA